MDKFKNLNEIEMLIKKAEKELEFLANHDVLTGLPSLRLGRDRLEQALVTARRNKENVAVMFLDLDGFKQVNDEHGHEAGDKVLKIVADRIRAEVREQDTVARIGGDEFLVVLRNMPKTDTLKKIASSMIDSVSQPVVFDHTSVAIGMSIGISLYPDNGDNVDELIRVADNTMYVVKSRGKKDYRFSPG